MTDEEAAELAKTYYLKRVRMKKAHVNWGVVVGFEIRHRRQVILVSGIPIGVEEFLENWEVEP